VQTRWLDRVTTDGSWSGNLFDFYRRVYGKLTADLKVPFKLRGDEREGETPVHVALREALENCLIHADFSGRRSILVVRRPSLFEFRNPGRVRLSLEQAIRGGESDCRNRSLQNMFLLIGRGERSGSGAPTIFQNWSNQHWRQPEMSEVLELQKETQLRLRTESLLPEPAVAAVT
jgi:ATP-dependent DNA helicase RecG